MGTGRPSKGHRIRMTTRVDPLIHHLAVRDAEARGLSVSEWLDVVVTAQVRPLIGADWREKRDEIA
jgi:predicted HicB family RNase H-like nuclease